MSSFSLYILVLYFFSIIATFSARFVNIKFGNRLAVAVALISFGVAAFRPWHFPDINGYTTMFENAASGAFDSPVYWLSHGEPGFKILSYLMSISGLNFSGFLITMAAMSCLLLLYIARISSVPFAYLWFTYFSFFFITRDLGVLRVGIASHLVVLAFLQRKLLWKFIILAIASFSFQYFAMVAMVAPILSRIKPTILILISLMLFAGVIGSTGFIDIYSVMPFVSEKITTGFIEQGYNENRGLPIVIPTVRNLFFASLLYWLMKKEIKLQKFRIWIWSAFLSVLCYLFFASLLIAAQRFSAYFGAIFPLAFAYLLSKPYLSSLKFFLLFFSVVFNFLLLFYYNQWVWRIVI